MSTIRLQQKRDTVHLYTDILQLLQYVHTHNFFKKTLRIFLGNMQPFELIKRLIYCMGKFYIL